MHIHTKTTRVGWGVWDAAANARDSCAKPYFPNPIGRGPGRARWVPFVRGGPMGSAVGLLSPPPTRAARTSAPKRVSACVPDCGLKWRGCCPWVPWVGSAGSRHAGRCFGPVVTESVLAWANAYNTYHMHAHTYNTCNTLHILIEKCACIWIQTYIHMYTHVCTYIQYTQYALNSGEINTYTYIHIHANTSSSKPHMHFLRPCLKCTYLHVLLYVWVCMSPVFLYVCVCMCMYCMYDVHILRLAHLPAKNTCNITGICTSAYSICTDTGKYMHIHAENTCTYIHMRIEICVCMCMYTVCISP